MSWCRIPSAVCCPGMTYQLGVLFGAPTNSVEYALRDRFGYQPAIAGFEVVVIVLLTVVTGMGRENKGKAFLHGVMILRFETRSRVLI